MISIYFEGGSSMVHTFLYILRVLYLYNIFTNMVISRKSLLPKPVLLKHAASTAMYIIRHYQIAIHAASGIFFCHVQNIEKILCSKMEIIRLFSFRIRLHSSSRTDPIKLCVSLWGKFWWRCNFTPTMIHNTV